MSEVRSTTFREKVHTNPGNLGRGNKIKVTQKVLL